MPVSTSSWNTILFIVVALWSSGLQEATKYGSFSQLLAI
jgi:hypothetical protein